MTDRELFAYALVAAQLVALGTTYVMGRLSGLRLHIKALRDYTNHLEMRLCERERRSNW